MKSGDPSNTQSPNKQRAIAPTSFIYQWLIESPQADNLSDKEAYVLLKLLRYAATTGTSFVQEPLKYLLKKMDMSINPFLKAVAGLEKVGVIQKIRDSEDSRAPLKYVFTVPSSTNDADDNARSVAPPAPPEPMSDSLLETVRVILFLSGDPIHMRRLSQITGHSYQSVKEALLSLQKEFVAKSLDIIQTASGYQMVARQEYYKYARLIKEPRPPLSETEREVITILFYCSPITRAGIAKIRSINPVDSLNSLVEKSFVAMKSRDTRSPLFYPTEKGLALFGLKDLSELPDRDKLMKEAIHKFNLQDETGWQIPNTDAPEVADQHTIGQPNSEPQ